MKTFNLIISMLFLLLTSSFQIGSTLQTQQTELQTGEYFIVNVATNDALTPVDVGVNSNTRLNDFKKSGMQKWTIKKNVVKNKKRTSVFYTIQNTASGYYLRPCHVPNNGSAIISTKDAMCSYSIKVDNKNFIIKNNKMGGDAMYVKKDGYQNNEPWFANDDGNENFRWKIVSTTGN